MRVNRIEAFSDGGFALAITFLALDLRTPMNTNGRDRVPVEAPAGAAGGAVDAWVSTMDARGVRLAGDPLAADDGAVAVRVRGGAVHVEQGAFLDTRGALFGFDLLECRDVDEAIAVAADHPFAARHVMELRPIASG